MLFYDIPNYVVELSFEVQPDEEIKVLQFSTELACIIPDDNPQAQPQSVDSDFPF
jgi:hypothetical protein